MAAMMPYRGTVPPWHLGLLYLDFVAINTLKKSLLVGRNGLQLKSPEHMYLRGCLPVGIVNGHISSHQQAWQLLNWLFWKKQSFISLSIVYNSSTLPLNQAFFFPRIQKKKKKKPHPKTAIILFIRGIPKCPLFSHATLAGSVDIFFQQPV